MGRCGVSVGSILLFRNVAHVFVSGEADAQHFMSGILDHGPARRRIIVQMGSIICSVFLISALVAERHTHNNTQ